MSNRYRERDRAIWHRIFSAIPPGWFDAPPSDAMERCRAYFQASRCARLLDVGCGFGRWSLFLDGYGAREIVGADYAENGIRAAAGWAHRTGSNARFVVATATCLPFAAASFDGILAALILDGLSRADLACALREISYSAAPGCRGFFVFNPLLTAAELAAVSGKNPTKQCKHVSYEDSELSNCLPGWKVTRIASSAEQFRLVEAVYGADSD